MSCIINDGDQDPSILINGFGKDTAIQIKVDILQ